jgi:hypothetical protein
LLDDVLPIGTLARPARDDVEDTEVRVRDIEDMMGPDLIGVRLMWNW